MDKEKQIEKMAKIIDEMYNVYDTTAGDIYKRYTTYFRAFGGLKIYFLIAKQSKAT